MHDEAWFRFGIICINFRKIYLRLTPTHPQIVHPFQWLRLLSVQFESNVFSFIGAVRRGVMLMFGLVTYVYSRLAVILLRKRELVALLTVRTFMPGPMGGYNLPVYVKV